MGWKTAVGRWIGVLALFLLLPSAARAQDPFGIEVRLHEEVEGWFVDVNFAIPAGHILYENTVAILPPEGVQFSSAAQPTAHEKPDPITGEMVRVFVGNITFSYRVNGWAGGDLPLTVTYQGCNDTVCFFPQKNSLVATAQPMPPRPVVRAPVSAAAPALDDWAEPAARFRITGTRAGYIAAGPFAEFIRAAKAGTDEQRDLLARVFDRYGLLVAALLILPLGVLLNLTPCVLPMIPINLAIIGAGVKGGGSRGRGLLLGGLYGAGMAVVYGVLGLVVVLTGSQFGTLSASPWFNTVVAVVFVVMSLAMFDVLHVDFSRFQGRVRTDGLQSRSPYGAAFVIGGLAALLAGACVAPVLISVLLLATDLHAKGNPAGLLLPFLLGIGMALPWPLAGAGLTRLPRPGKWMDHVKHGFGVLILLTALYYGKTAWDGFAYRSGAAKTVNTEGWVTDLAAGLRQGLDEGKPVFIDFWATWCKNCHAMDETSFKDPDVIAALANCVRVKYRAEDPSDPATKAVLDYFGSKGLPTYVVLVPGAR